MNTIMAWMIASSLTVTSLSTGVVTAYAQEEGQTAEVFSADSGEVQEETSGNSDAETYSEFGDGTETDGTVENGTDNEELTGNVDGPDAKTDAGNEPEQDGTDTGNESDQSETDTGNEPDQSETDTGNEPGQDGTDTGNELDQSGAETGQPDQSQPDQESDQNESGSDLSDPETSDQETLDQNDSEQDVLEPDQSEPEKSEADASVDDEGKIAEFSAESTAETELDLENDGLELNEESATVAKAAPADAEYWCGHYYKVYDSVKSPSAAAKFCKSQGGYLATITSKGENDVIQGLLSNKSSRLNGYLLGGSKNESASTDWRYQYSWSNGEKNLLSIGDVGARFWCGDTTLPLTMGTGDYLAMSGLLSYKHYFGWVWYDSSKSDQSYGFICEWGDPVDVAKAEITLSRDRFVVNGQPQKPDVTVTYEGQKLEENYDYTYDFSNNINIGKARCTIKGIGRFNGQQTVTFDIVPSAIKELRGNNFLGTDTRTAYTNADRKMEVAWDKASDSNIDGYDIWYSKSEKFESYKKYSVNKSKTEFTSGSLERGTTYYAKVRAYKKVPEGKIEGEWSNVLTVKSGKQVLVNEMWGFSNLADITVTAKYFYKLFSATPAQADEAYKNFGGTANSPANIGGVCNGMVTAGVAAYDPGVPSDLYGLSSLNKATDFNKTDTYRSKQLGMNAKDALIYASLSQMFVASINAERKNENNLYGFYNAVIDCQKGGNGPVTVGLSESGTLNHKILAVGIISETDKDVEIAVYDPNRKNDKNARLYLKKENGSLSGWSYYDPTGGFRWEGKVSTAKAEDDCLAYDIESSGIVAIKLKQLSEGTNNSANDLKNYFLVTADFPSNKKVYTSFAEYFRNKMQNNTRVNIKNASGASGTTRESFWVRNNGWLSMDDVPAGVVLSIASADHAVSVTTTQKASITINAADTNANKVYVTSSIPGSFTTTFKDYTDISEPVKETTINAACKANTTVTVNQTIDQKIQLNGADSASYTRDEGTRNTNTGKLNNFKREEMKKTALDAEKSYQIEREKSNMVLSTSSKNNNVYDEVVQKTPADHKHTWDSGKVTKAATCKATGVKTYTCSGCKQTKTAVIKKTNNHKWSAWKTVTAAKIGKTGVKQRSCSVCKQTQKGVIPALPTVVKIKITGFSARYSGGNVKATIKWSAASKAKKYRICSGYTNSKTYSRKEKAAAGTRSITVSKAVSSKALNRFWVEAYDSNGNLCGKSDEKYYMRETTITSLKAGKNCFVLKWKKTSPGVSGYQIQYSTAANFKNAKTVTVKSATALTRKVTGLKKGRYYVRIRSYGKVKGKTCYSGWSSTKKVSIN